MIPHFKTKENAYLSNFYIIDVEIDGMIFPSSEHAYMSYKCNDPAWKVICQDRSNTPAQIKKFSNLEKFKKIMVPDWQDIKIGVMERVVEKKFYKEPLRSKLLATGNENIQEGNWHNDTFWGVDLKNCPNLGENHLGRLIMKVREKLKNNEL